MTCRNHNCNQGRDCPRRKEDKFATLITIILVVMVGLLIVRSCYAA